MLLKTLFNNPLKLLLHSGWLILLTTVPACTPLQEGPVSPSRLPSRTSSVSLQAVTLAADLYTDRELASQFFGFDIRAANLLPVRCRIDNRGRLPVYVQPQQAFLIDRQNLAWPLLTGEQVQTRLNALAWPDATRSAALSRLWGTPPHSASGLAFGLRHENDPLLKNAGLIGRLGRQMDLSLDARQTTRRPHGLVHAVEPNDLAVAYLLFPDRADADSAVSLRLGLEMDGVARSVHVPLTRQ